MEARELYFIQKVDPVFRYLYYFTSDLQDATFLTVTTFSHIFRKWNQLEQQKDFDTYTLSYAHHMASKQVRKEKGKRERSEHNTKQNVKQKKVSSTHWIPVEIAPPEKIMYLFDSQKLLLPFLQAVTPNIRSVLILCGIEGFSIEQVSKLLGYTKKRTSSLFHHGVQALQTGVKEQLTVNQNARQTNDTTSCEESNVSEGLEDGTILTVLQISEEWIIQEISRFPRFTITQWEKEELYATTCRINRRAIKKRITRMLLVSVGMILVGSTVFLGEWRYGWVTRLSQNVVYALEGTVPNIVPEQTKVDQNSKSEIIINKDVIHGGSNSEDAVGALHETVKSAPFNVYYVLNAMFQQQDVGGMYLTDTRYDKKKQTLDLEYRLVDKVIHVWEAPSSQIKDRYKNQGQQQRFSARPWYVRNTGGQTVYSTVFCGTMIEFQTESLADSMQILDGLYSPSNFCFYTGKSTHWEVHLTLRKNEDPVDTINQSVFVLYSERANGQDIVQTKPLNIGPMSVRVEGSGIHSYELKHVSMQPGATAYSDTVQYHQSALPSADDRIRIQIKWQGKTEIIDLKALPRDVIF